MQIDVLSAFAGGPTALSAFDTALAGVGIHDFNLVALSSVVPPNAQLSVAKTYDGPGDVGDRLYVVMAEQRCAPREEAWAGLLWVTTPLDGSGIFLEAHGPTEDFVRDELEIGAEAMLATRHDRPWNEPEIVLVGGRAGPDEYGCALVAAPFHTVPWAP